MYLDGIPSSTRTTSCSRLEFIQRRVRHPTVIGAGEVSGFHDGFIEVAEVLVRDEVGGFAEAHVVGAAPKTSSIST